MITVMMTMMRHKCKRETVWGLIIRRGKGEGMGEWSMLQIYEDNIKNPPSTVKKKGKRGREGLRKCNLGINLFKIHCIHL
jgi:hypothetical protein